MRERNPRGDSNGQLPAERLASILRLSPEARTLWERLHDQRKLSARSSQRLLRVARTISDLAADEEVGTAAIAEALTYRSFDPSASPP
jgi:magnesium chelatase family protein